MNTSPPKIEQHGQFYVARDDLLSDGGTKSRYLEALFRGDVKEIVYASPVQGAAQIALAIKAQDLKRRCTIFCAKRGEWHENTKITHSYGAKIIEVDPGYFNHVTSQAKHYALRSYGAHLAPFGLRVPEAIDCLTQACKKISRDFDEVWCAAGSGTLAEALGFAFPKARIFAVSVGHHIKEGEAGRAKVMRYDEIEEDGTFDKPAKIVPPFPCNMTFDAKGWEIMQLVSHSKRALFWNVDSDHEVSR